MSNPPAPWISPPPTYDTSYTTTTLTPYLQLPHLLSLTWLAYPILSLIFVAFRLQLSLAASQDAVANAKGDILSSCQAAEHAATSAASMPRIMAIATNEQFVDAVNGSLNGVRYVLTTSLTVMEAIVNFIVDLYRSTLLCFLELVVRGGLSIILGAVQEVDNLLKSTANGLKSSIESDIQSANSAIKSFIDGVNKVNPFSDIQAPQINVPNLDGLTNLQLPTSIQDSLNNLNSSLPSVSQLKEGIESIIDTPFELLKKEINDTFAEISFDSSVMPIPAQNRLSFCNDVDLSVVDDIGDDLIKTAKIGTIILIVLALVLIGLNCLLTWYKWRCMKAHLEYTRQAWLTDPTMYHHKTAQGVPQLTLTDHNLLMLQASSAHPLVTRITNRLSQLLRLSPSQHTHLQWFLNYIFHPPAVAVFLIGFFGLLCVELQLLAMGPLVAKYQDRAASTVSDFSNTIATSINDNMRNQSAAYANDVNSRVDAVQKTLNDGLFGWVNQTTTGLNTTLNQFYSDVENAVNSVFGGTILESPAQEFVRCFIGSKIDAVENMLTFLHDNLKVDMPRMNDSVLMLSQATVDETVQPIAAAAIGGGADDDQGLIGRLVNSYADSLRKERIMFIIFLGLWGVVILMGLAVVFWHAYGRRFMENRKKKRWARRRDQNLDGPGLAAPFRDTTSPHQDHNPPSSWTVMNRAASPSESIGDPEKSWDSHLGENLPKNNVEQRKGFMANAKEKLVHRKPPPVFIPNEEKRHTPWFTRVTSLLHKKDSQDVTETDRNIGVPQLQSTSYGFNDVSRSVNEPPVFVNNEPKSHWSPDNESEPSWASLMTPSKASAALPSATLSPTSHKSPPPYRFVISPPRPLQPRRARNVSGVPSEPGSPLNAHGSFAAQSPAGFQQPLNPIPLHYGYDSGYSRFPVPSSNSRKHQEEPVASSASPIQTGPNHRRSVSFPAVSQGKDVAGLDEENGIADVADNVGRLLTASNRPFTRQPSRVLSPFDDVHKVKIDKPVMTRKSIPTNPFEGGVAV